MQRSPFRLFQPFAERFSVTLYGKEDHMNKDQNITQALAGQPFAMPRQVHGNRTIRARRPILQTEDADGIVTDQSGLMLAVAVADCQSFIVYAPDHHVAGLLHSGWRGLLTGAIPAFFDVLQREWRVAPADVFVAIGPSLCLKCSEFTDPVHELPGVDPHFFSGRLVDLRGIADAELLRLGVSPARRERHPDCTRCGHDLWWSYRGPDRDQVKQGWENIITCAPLL